MAQELVTYEDIQDAILEALGIQQTDTIARNKVKRMINQVYLDEVVPFKNWMWLQKTFPVIHQAAYATGTINVTNGSASAILSTAPTGLNFTNYKFSVDDSDQIYTVGTHTTSSTTLPINVAFQEDSNATATFKIWRDRVDLPTTIRETVDVWHKGLSQPLEGCGSQTFREKEVANPKREGFPLIYNTYDYFDPDTSGDDETEDDRYRQTRIYPAITDENVILNFDAIQEATALDEDEDEPLMPIADRIVLFYGGMKLAARQLARNEEMSQLYQMDYDRKLARMSGNREERPDQPKMTPNSSYYNAMRRSGLRRRGRGFRGW